jgi:hypothetical protein
MAGKLRASPQYQLEPRILEAYEETMSLPIYGEFGLRIGSR